MMFRSHSELLSPRLLDAYRDILAGDSCCGR